MMLTSQSSFSRLRADTHFACDADTKGIFVENVRRPSTDIAQFGHLTETCATAGSYVSALRQVTRENNALSRRNVQTSGLGGEV